MDINSSRRILLITSGQPSLNPRLVKEADILADAGYDVTVLYAYWNEWGSVFDNKLLSGRKWEAKLVGGHPEVSPFTYFMNRVINKAAKFGYKLFGTNFFAKKAIGLSSFYLQREAKKHQADLYIGHNLGALPATVYAARKNKKPCGFDAEDFHRFESSDDPLSPHYKLVKQLEDQYLPEVTYITASSLLIAKEYEKLYQFTVTTLLNVFPINRENTTLHHSPMDPVKLFWFSQTIGDKRGLIDIVKALQTVGNAGFELHLLGGQTTSSESFIDKINAYGIDIRYHAPIEPDKLTHFASQFDIGLALEPAFSVNNNFALSNKIFTYLQAGLAVIASDTAAQKAFFSQYPHTGKTYPKTDFATLAKLLVYYRDNREELQKTRTAAFEAACTTLNWETEGQKFLKIVDQTINSHS